MNLPVNRSSRILCIASLLTVCLLISGCWDRREIQDRNFVLGMAIDDAATNTAQQPGGQKQFMDLDPRIYGGREYQLSLQVLRLTPAKGEESGSKAGGSGKTFVLSDSGRSILEMVRDINAKNGKALWFEHIQVLIINEQVLKNHSLDALIDFFRRDVEVRYITRVFVTSGSAKAVLEIEPPGGEAGGLFLTNIARNVTKNPHLATAGINLGYVVRQLDLKADLILPRIELSGKEVKITGMAMFKKDRFVGYVDDYAVKGIKLLRGLAKAGLITTECPDHPGESVTFEFLRQDTILESHIEGDNIYFTVNIALRGNIGEGLCSARHKADDPAFLTRLGASVAREVDRNIQYGLAESQRLGVDDVQFGSYLKAYKPKAWAKLKDRWDEIFPTVPVYVTCRVSIMNQGDHK